MKTTEKFKQKKYPDLEFDNREKDIILIWMNGKDTSDVIILEREKVNQFIDLLKKLNK